MACSWQASRVTNVDRGTLNVQVGRVIGVMAEELGQQPRPWLCMGCERRLLCLGGRGASLK